MNTIDGNVIGATADPVWVKVAAAGSLPAAKSAADFVCAGEHDEETLQAAIDRCAADGRDLFLFDGIYNIDAFREWADGGPRAALRIPVMLRHFTVRGEKFFQAGRSTIPDDKAVWKNGAVLYVRKPAWNTTGKVIRAKALNYMRFIEEWGRGLRRVNAILRDYGLKDAEMEDAGLAVRSRRARLGI